MDRRSPVSRRSVLRTAAGVSVVVGAGGVSSPVSAQRGTEGEIPDFEELDGVDGGIEDRRGESVVTIEVGASGNGGNLAFSPAGLWIDPGTTVVWEWTGEGGSHNVVASDGPAEFESDLLAEAGATFDFEFTEAHAGITNYECQPHAALGMVGAVAVGDDVPTTDRVDDSDEPEPEVVDLRGQDQVTVEVGSEGNGGNVAFSPADIWIDPGTTVVWEWIGEGGGHNVVTTDGPAALESELAEEAGFTYAFEFTDTHAGITNYECQPHVSLGMVGSVAVGDDVQIRDRVDESDEPEEDSLDESVENGTDNVDEPEDSDADSVDESATTEEASLNESGASETNSTDSTETASENETDDNASSDITSIDTPGFGVVEALAGIAGVSQLLRNRQSDEPSS